jgi:hypothetical protein
MRVFGRPVYLTVVLCLGLASRAEAQVLDAAARSAVIDDLIERLQADYVFPEKALAAAEDLRARRARGDYDAIGERAAFARTLTEHLQALTHDLHLRVRSAPPSVGGPAGGNRQPDPSGAFGRVEILEGNVGYVEILSFGFPPQAIRAATSDALTKVADADALIFDVRANGGGHPGFVALVSSYIFGPEPVHLNSLYFRPADRTDHFYTDPDVDGKKFGATKPVFVLTSQRTFSAAEEFTYNLQARKRATIVGETTGGGAHPGGGQPLAHGMFVFVPSGRAINPITGTNWEGVGVVPEVKVTAAEALDAALKLVAERNRQHIF